MLSEDWPRHLSFRHSDVTDDRPTPQLRETLWRLHKEGTAASCERLEHVEGWELVVRNDHDITGTRRHNSERVARHYADALRQDYLRDGWIE